MIFAFFLFHCMNACMNVRHKRVEMDSFLFRYLKWASNLDMQFTDSELICNISTHWFTANIK